MATPPEIVVREEPTLSRSEVWDFYVENACCEQRYSSERATSVLAKSDVIVTARDRGKLVGLARAITDGLSGSIMELSVALSHQGEQATNQTGALVEDDAFGVGRRLAEVLVNALVARGVDFIDGSVYESEVETYQKAGFSINTGHLVMYLDRRPPWNG